MKGLKTNGFEAFLLSISFNIPRSVQVQDSYPI